MREPQGLPPREAILDYDRNKGNFCPYCNTEELRYDDWHFDCGVVEVEVGCHNCGREWFDQYRFANIVFRPEDLENTCFTKANRLILWAASLLQRAAARLTTSQFSFANCAPSTAHPYRARAPWSGRTPETPSA